MRNIPSYHQRKSFPSLRPEHWQWPTGLTHGIGQESVEGTNLSFEAYESMDGHCLTGDCNWCGMAVSDWEIWDRKRGGETKLPLQGSMSVGI